MIFRGPRLLASELSTKLSTKTVEIAENTSWSCSHGVERWRSDCGCSTGVSTGWNQRWRQPLRDGLDWLRDQVASIFETEGTTLLRDPWSARDDYIDVILDRSAESVSKFLQKHAGEDTGAPLRIGRTIVNVLPSPN